MKKKDEPGFLEQGAHNWPANYSWHNSPYMNEESETEYLSRTGVVVFVVLLILFLIFYLKA